MNSDWSDQVPRDQKNQRRYQTAKCGKDHGADAIRPVNSRENQGRCDDCRRGWHAAQQQQIHKIETKNSLLAQRDKDQANCIIQVFEQ